MLQRGKPRGDQPQDLLHLQSRPLLKGEGDAAEGQFFIKPDKEGRDMRCLFQPGLEVLGEEPADNLLPEREAAA